MTPPDAQEHARSYVDRVLQSQRELGYESKPSEDDYKRAIDRAAQAFTDLLDSESTEKDAVDDDFAVPA